MVLDFTPRTGDRVKVFGYHGEFKIADSGIDPHGQYRFRLEPLFDGPVLEDVTYGKLDYSDEERVRKVMPQVLTAVGPPPDDFELGEHSYEISSDEMHDGTPRVLVTFHLKPDAHPTLDRARASNDFFARLHEQFKFVDIQSWLQFTAKEVGSALRAVS